MLLRTSFCPRRHAAPSGFLTRTAVAMGLGLSAWVAPCHALSIDVAVSTLQSQAEKAFPKTKNSLTLSEPMLALEGATEVVVLCGRWDYAPKLLGATVERGLGGKFCAESRLQWNAEPGTVALSAVRVRSLTLGDAQPLPGPLLAVVNAVLPGQLEGVVVYTAPKWLGWAVKNLRPLDGRLQVEF